MSTLEVNIIKPISGSSTVTLGESGDTIALASGASQTLAVMTPAFFAYGSGSNQTIPDQTGTKVTVFNTELFDSHNFFSSNRFTPTIAGKYFCYANLYWDTTSANDLHNGAVQLRKNGSNYTTIENNLNSHGSAMAAHVGAVIDFNGSSDYAEIYCYQNTASGNSCTVYASQQLSNFGAYKVIGV